MYSAHCYDLIITRISCQRQGACAGNLLVKAAKILPLVGLARSSKTQSKAGTVLSVCTSATYQNVLNCMASMQALAPLERYPTKVAIRVLTNQPQRLRLAMQSWSSQALVCSPEAALSHRYQLAFAHRTYMEEALKSTDPGTSTLGCPCMHSLLLLYLVIYTMQLRRGLQSHHRVKLLENIWTRCDICTTPQRQ